MNMTSTTFGIRCWDCSATHMMAYSWKHFWMSLWVCCVAKRRFIVLKEISFGTITLGESFRWLVWLHLPAQTLLGTRVRGEPALDKWRSRRRSAARSFKYTASGTIAIKVAVHIGTIATIALALPQVICWASVAARGFLPLGGPRAQQNIQRGLHTALLLIVTFLLVPYRGVS